MDELRRFTMPVRAVFSLAFCSLAYRCPAFAFYLETDLRQRMDAQPTHRSSSLTTDDSTFR
jgi:hypothetical protein